MDSSDDVVVKVAEKVSVSEYGIVSWDVIVVLSLSIVSHKHRLINTDTHSVNI
jgi:hypothetical protein